MITESPRLILRQFRDGDQQALFAMNSTPEVLRYIPGEPLKDIEGAAQVLEKVILADYRKYGYGRWAVEHKADGKVISFAVLSFCRSSARLSWDTDICLNTGAWGWVMKPQAMHCPK